MRLLLQHGADAKFVHRASFVSGEAYKPRKEETNAVMAAAGLGSGKAWVDVPKTRVEPLALEAIKVAVDAGVDVNLAGLDGRTALDAATNSKYATVAAFLTDHGAKPGAPAAK
jgi:ankyrin repeat protein